MKLRFITTQNSDIWKIKFKGTGKLYLMHMDTWEQTWR